MQVDYQPFIDRVIQKYEGGYGWNTKDPGGPTKYGITCYDYAEYRHRPMNSMSEWAPLVKAMTLSEAESIYRTKYAAGCAFDTLAAGLDCCALDYGINSGVSRANLVRNRIAVTYPGISTADFVNRMCDERLRFMQSIRGGSAWAEFGHGWGARVDDLRSYCVALAAGSPPNPDVKPDLTKVVQPKATHVPKTAGAATGAGTTGTVIAAHTAGLHWPTIAGLAAAAIAAGLVFEAWAAGAAAKANATVHL